MNVRAEKAEANQAYVRDLLRERYLEFARITEYLVREETMRFVVVGFGDCETDVPPRYGADEMDF